MWRMQTGNRVLTSAEWSCLAIGVGYLFDQVCADVDDETDDAQSGVAIFDRLTAEQKLLILADVTEALVRKRVPWPELNAVREGTVAAMFASLEFLVLLEVEMGRRKTIRKALLAALADDPPEEMPKPSCTDESEWELMVECFTDRVLWDRDFDIDVVADLPPEAAAALDEQMRFGDGYFSDAADEPTKAELKKARAKLNRLLKAASGP